jgi:YfiH family protein
VNYRFTNRTGGLSTGAFHSLNLALHVEDDPGTVIQNRKIVEEELAMPVAYMNQVHGEAVVEVDAPLLIAPTADALITRQKNLALAVMVADCIPLLMAHSSAVAAVHVGRRGLVNGVALETLTALRAIDSSPITAVIGPSICGSCYEVSEDLFNEVVDLHPAATSRTTEGTRALDLVQALIEVLRAESVTVIDESRCTVEDPTLYSYRRDGVTGRQTGVIWL